MMVKFSAQRLLEEERILRYNNRLARAWPNALRETTKAKPNSQAASEYIAQHPVPPQLMIASYHRDRCPYCLEYRDSLLRRGDGRICVRCLDAAGNVLGDGAPPVAWKGPYEPSTIDRCFFCLRPYWELERIVVGKTASICKECALKLNHLA